MKFRNKLLAATAAAMLLLSNAAFAADDEDEDDEEDEEQQVEEMVVTGSFIRRDNFDLPSPMATIDEVDLELAGTPDLGDIIFDQTFQVGVNAYSAPFEFGGGDDQDWQQGGEVWANLRGLGTRATMTMMDGHRVPANVTGYSWWTRRAGTDLTNLYPGIAIGRVETILDGASALYGSEAVSGVINLVPRKEFDGLMVNYEYEQPIENGAPSTRVGLLAGAQGERTKLIFALEIRDQERMKLTDRPDYIVSTANWTGQYLPSYNDTGRGNPGDWSVPTRGPDGSLQPYSGNNWTQIEGQWFDYGGSGSRTGDNQGRVASQRRVDPGCGYPFGAGNDDIPQRPALDPTGDNPNKTVDDDDHVSGLGYTDHRLPGNFLNGYMTGGLRGLSYWEGSEGDWSGARDDCRQVLSDWQDIREQRDQQQGMAYFEHELNDYVQIHGELVVSNMDYDTRDIPGNLDEWDGRSIYGNNVPVVVGSNPGNPFRAFADGAGLYGWAARNGQLDYNDVNGNGRYDYLEEPGEFYVFAQDVNGDGIPDRDRDGDGLPDEGAQRQPEYRVALMPIYADADGDGVLDSLADADGDGIADRFDPDSGGIRLFEDVKLQSLTISPKQPYGNTISWLNDDMTYSRRRQIDNLRLRLGTEVNIPDTEWIVDLDWIWATSKREEDYAEPVWPWAVASMRCQGGQYADQCWNPFSTAWLGSDEDGQILPEWRDADDPAANTELEHRNAGVLLRHDQRNIGTYIIDATISTSSLFNLWYNDAPVGFAAGTHWRLETEEYRPNQLGASALGSARTNFQYTEEETQAVFMEVQLPLISSPRWGEMEAQLALRYAEFEGRGTILVGNDRATFDTVIPKIAVRYAPVDWLAFRGSLTQGFVLPGMFQLFQTTDRPDSFDTVRDYICDLLPEVRDCADVPQGGAVPNVLTPDTRNASLGAEESDLWNAGVSLRLLDGDLTFDVDYTTVDFEGRVERLGSSANVNVNEIGFRPFMEAACPGTLLNYDDSSAVGPGASIITPAEFLMSGSEGYAGTPEEEVACRLAAAQDYVANYEMGLGGAVLIRGGEQGLRLLEAGDPWLNQGKQTTTTMIYASRYRFDADALPWIGGDYGTFELNMSATQMLEMSMTRYAAGSGHLFEAITVDGVGNRNNANWPGSGSYLAGGLFSPLPPTPEWRVNAGLRWFRDNHVAQLRVRWHDELTDISASWDEVEHIPGAIDRSGTHNGQAIENWTEADACTDQDRNPYCNIDSAHYWDLSYTYTQPDVMGFGYVSVNVAVRNIFNSMPDPIPSGVGHETYVDNIMGRIGFARLTVGF